MIYIAAKLKCDHWTCKAAADVVLEMTKSDHDIPELTIQDMPKGWGRANWDINGSHYCPEHNK